MSYLLALDAGTGSIRAVIFDLSGHQLAVGQAEWQHLSIENVPGSMEFDLTTNWQLALPVHSPGAGKRSSPGGRYSVRGLLFNARRHRAVRS